MNQRQLFLQHVAQTSTAPLAIEINKAEKSSLFDSDGKEYIDLIGGISVANMGHRHPKVVKAIHQQLDAYMHIMVYGELVQTPQVQFATALAAHLPASLNTVYFTNSGAEAVEGAMKLAKRASNRAHIFACNFSYHGSTQGALSILGDEYWRNAYRPLLPGIYHVDYNSFEWIEKIDNQTAAVIIETVQAEAGINPPSKEWIQALRKKCTEQGALLIMDEIQTGFGRTGKLWGFDHFDVVPDIVLLGKALGGGMPMGAFIADRSLMMQLAENPVLGHLTTFGGHPVCCAAGFAAFEALLEEKIVDAVSKKEQLFIEYLQHPKIKSINHFGLWMAVQFDSFESNKKVIDALLLQSPKAVFTDWFLFASDSLRISPPLVITEDEIREACKLMLKVIDEVL